FAKYVRGRAEIDYASILAPFGVRVEISQPDRNRATLGATMAEADGRLTIRTVPAGSPAFDQGLNTGDQIVAIDGFRASNTFLQSYLSEKKPGDTVRLTLFRFDRLRDMNFVLGANTRQRVSLEPVDSPTESQRRLFREYFGSDL